VRFIFSKFGVTLPRTARDQARVGDRVRADWNTLQPGDLVMFQDDGGINHVAIYAGHARIIHSSETGGGVRIDDLTSERGRWFAQRLVGARRVRPDARGAIRDLARGFPDNGSYDTPDHAPRASLKRRQ
jgi:cell wall-associated NlpC family hydrolase